MEQSLDLLSNDLQITPSSENILLDTARWGKFLAIIGFIFCGIMLIMAFYLGSVVSQSYRYRSAFSNVGPVVTTVYVILGIILFFPCFFLYKFSAKMQIAFKTVNQEQFEDSIQNLKSMFKYLGIVTIIILSFWILSLLAVVITGS